MHRKEPVLISWSSGKDCALALAEIRRAGRYEAAGLLTTLTAAYGRVSMHGVREKLLDEQAACLALPLTKVYLSPAPTNQEYDEKMAAVLAEQRTRGIRRVVFGDLFLEGIRRYREKRLAAVGMEALFPLWGMDTARLAARLPREGWRALLTCVDTAQLAGDFAGRIIDESFLADLPPGVDPCGENGEFHTFVSAAPIFNRPLHVRPGEKVLRDDRFLFCDVLTGRDHPGEDASGVFVPPTTHR